MELETQDKESKKKEPEKTKKDEMEKKEKKGKEDKARKGVRHSLVCMDHTGGEAAWLVQGMKSRSKDICIPGSGNHVESVTVQICTHDQCWTRGVHK